MSDHTELEDYLGEMAAQADDSSVRDEVERRIADTPWAQEMWRELLRENDRFRQELSNCQAPTELEQRLLSEPVVRLNKELPKRRWRHRIWVAAIVLVVAVGIVWILQQQDDSRYETVALLAISNHLDHMDSHDLPMRPAQPLAEEMTEIVEFEVRFPDFGERLDLINGRKCKLGTRTVAFSLWQNDQGNYSLFQFQPEEFGLPNNLPARIVRTSEPAGEEHTSGAWIWTKDSAGYVLVGDPGCEINDLRPRR